MKDEINKYGFPKKLARYYRYVFNPNGYIAGLAAGAGTQTLSDRAVFSDMPADDVLTMGVTYTPGTWLYESLVCKHDLDNLLLSSISSTRKVFAHRSDIPMMAIDQLALSLVCALRRA